MKYFVASDLHGCFDIWMEALKEAGFDQDNPKHILVLAGDSFDRGTQNAEIAIYIQNMYARNQLIYILGNHDFFFEDILNEDIDGVYFNMEYNGFERTVRQIYGTNIIPDVIEKEKEIGFAKWLLSIGKLYHEFNDYVVVHAGIPNDINWRSSIGKDSTWIHTDNLFVQDLIHLIGEKKLVCGHWHAVRLRGGRYEVFEHHKTYYSEDGQKIGIDSCTNYSDFVNILVIDEDEEDSDTCSQ